MQKVVREIVDVVGLEIALQIVSRWGGRRFHVPARVGRFHPLALTIGYEPACRLVEAFRDQELDIPVERNVLLEIRNRMIVRAHEQGVSLSDIAAQYGLTRQGVRKVIERAGGSQPIPGLD